MLKAKQIPKKKQNKKPAKNDGKITKKKYIKTKIIGGGKMIQLLTLNEKLDFLKECLKKYVFFINSNTGNGYFQYYENIISKRPFTDNFLDKFNSHGEDVISFISNLQFILLCLYDHDNYDSYTLLKIYYEMHFVSDRDKLFDTIKIDEGKETILLADALRYYNIYVKLLNDFIKKIISVANPSVEKGEGLATEVEEEEESDVKEQNEGEAENAENIEKAAGGTGPQSQFKTGVTGGLPKFTQKRTTIPKEEKERQIFESSMFDIYSEGIVLLTIDKEEDYNLKVFKSINIKEDYEISNKQKIINFLNDNRDSLIIRIYKNPDNDNHFYDCRLQLMYKLVNILIDNIDNYKDALKTQLETNLKTQGKTFLPKYKTKLLDKLIAIIFEKLPDKVSHIKYGIILKSLKVIILNNKGIDDAYIDNEYTKYLKNRNTFDDDINSIIAASKDKMPKYAFADTCVNRREYFEHIINVLYTKKDSVNEKTEKYSDEEVKEDLEILIKLSTSNDVTGLLEKTCKTTIDKIIGEKGYLISEANIQSLELKDKYKVLDQDIIDEINMELRKYITLIIDTYINDDNVGLYLDKKYEPTKNAILKIYDEFKKDFNKKNIELKLDVVVEIFKNVKVKYRVNTGQNIKTLEKQI
jgi:hypothetical protein